MTNTDKINISLFLSIICLLFTFPIYFYSSIMGFCATILISYWLISTLYIFCDRFDNDKLLENQGLC